MTPDQLCKSGSEHSHQVAFFAYMAVAKLHGWELADAWSQTGQAFPWDGKRKVLPELEWLHAIPNGGARGDSAKSATIRGQALKAEGVKAGVADVFLPYPRKRKNGNHYLFEYCGLYIEFKTPKLKPQREATSKGGLSDEQVGFKLYAQSNGYGWAVCYSWREAVAMVRSYLCWEI